MANDVNVLCSRTMISNRQSRRKRRTSVLLRRPVDGVETRKKITNGRKAVKRLDDEKG